MAIYALGDLVPNIHPEAFVHPDAVIIGNVTIGAHSSVWPTAVLRGDRGYIRVGERTSVQDGSIIHTTTENPTIIGSDCVIGHNVHMEGCQIADFALIGSGSVVLHGVIVESGAIVGAGAVVPNGLLVPAKALAVGIPAKIKPDAADPSVIQHSVDMYIKNASWYREELRLIK